MSTLKATNIKNESSASNNIVLDSGGGAVFSGILTATTFVGDGSQLSGLSKVLTIGTRTGIVTFSFTTSSFNVSGRSGNISINV